ncbi:MAG: hypothetical protein QXS54_07340 [Candidatus Methanomethylicaceae archaeon]
MSHSRFLILALIFTVISACIPRTSQLGEATPPPSVTLTITAPGPMPTWTPGYAQAFTIEIMIGCGRGGNGTYFTTLSGVALCFEEPGFFEASGEIDYFVLMVRYRGVPELQVWGYGVLKNILPTATPHPALPSGPTFTPVPPYILTLTPAWPRPPTPSVLRRITLEAKGYCEKPISSTSLERVTVCFAEPTQSLFEYWTVTISRELPPRAQHGLVEWSPPTP